MFFRYVEYIVDSLSLTVVVVHSSFSVVVRVDMSCHVTDMTGTLRCLQKEMATYRH